MFAVQVGDVAGTQVLDQFRVDHLYGLGNVQDVGRQLADGGLFHPIQALHAAGDDDLLRHIVTAGSAIASPPIRVAAQTPIIRRAHIRPTPHAITSYS